DLAPEPHEPASTWTRRVLAAQPRAAAGLAPLSARFVEWQYAGRKADPASARALARDLLAHRPGRRGLLEDPTRNWTPSGCFPSPAWRSPARCLPAAPPTRRRCRASTCRSRHSRLAPATEPGPRCAGAGA